MWTRGIDRDPREAAQASAAPWLPVREADERASWRSAREADRTLGGTVREGRDRAARPARARSPVLISGTLCYAAPFRRARAAALSRRMATPRRAAARAISRNSPSRISRSPRSAVAWRQSLLSLLMPARAG